MSTISTHDRSSWITLVCYSPDHPGAKNGFLVVFMRPDPARPEQAVIYSQVPSFIPGLLIAGTARTPDDGSERYRSIGRAYSKLVKGKYSSQAVTDPAKVKELKQLFSKEI